MFTWSRRASWRHWRSKLTSRTLSLAHLTCSSSTTERATTSETCFSLATSGENRVGPKTSKWWVRLRSLRLAVVFCIPALRCLQWHEWCWITRKQDTTGHNLKAGRRRGSRSGFAEYLPGLILSDAWREAQTGPTVDRVIALERSNIWCFIYVGGGKRKQFLQLSWRWWCISGQLYTSLRLLWWLCSPWANMNESPHYTHPWSQTSHSFHSSVLVCSCVLLP